MLLNLEELKQPPFYHEMILVEGGSFIMGNDDEEAFGNEKIIHKVEINAFQIAKCPVTQALWKAVMGDNPSCFIGDSLPVEQVSWDETQIFIQKIKEQTGIEYRLPTEAEWEFAARGGIKGKGFGNEKKACKNAGRYVHDEVSWYNENSHEETKPVGLKYPNELGLYDMSGNVWEWCQDWYDSDYYEECKKEGVVLDPQGSKEGFFRITRGGSWDYSRQGCHPSARLYWYPNCRYYDVGFRLASAPV